MHWSVTPNTNTCTTTNTNGHSRLDSTASLEQANAFEQLRDASGPSQSDWRPWEPRMSTGKYVQECYKELQNYSKHLSDAFDNSAPLRIFRSGLLPTLNSVAARISKGLPGQLPSFSFGTIGWPPKKLTRVTFEQLEQRQGRETGCSQPIRRALHEQQGPIYLSGPESFSETLDTPMISTSSLIAVTLPYVSTLEATSTEHAGD